MLFIVKSGVLLNGRALTSVRVIASNTSSASTISVPSGIEKGDVLILGQYSNGGSPPAQVAPSGFANILYQTTINNSIEA